MEASPFKSPESSSDDDSTESVGSTSKDKKKSSSSAAAMVGYAAERPIKKSESQNAAPTFDSILRRIRGESSKDTSIIGLNKPEQSPNVTPHKLGQTLLKSPDASNSLSEHSSQKEHLAAEKLTDVQDATLPESSESVDADSEAIEIRQAVQEFTEVRLQEADGEFHELPLDQQATPEAAAIAADVALLHAVRHNLADTSGQPAAEAIAAAERAVSEHVSSLPHSESDPSSPSETEPLETVSAETPVEAAAEPLAALPHDAERSPDFTRPYGPEYARPVATAAVESGSSDMTGDPRRAAAQSLLVGGIAGYFVGRRKGKKLGRREAERQSRPVRRSLERQVRSLQEAVTDKETRIKNLARERLQNVARPAEREQMVRDILEPSRADRPPILRTTPLNELRVRGGAPTSEILVVSVAAQSRERPVAPQTAEKQPAIPAKKVEDFTRAELLSTAEKIVVQGVTVRDMLELGTLGEQSARRVVAEFLEGKDVSAAVSREVGHTERRYEQDPHLRQAQARQAALVGGGVLGVLAPESIELGTEVTPRSQHTAPADHSSLQTSGHPEPDAATVQALRKRQAATVGFTAMIVAIVVTLLIIATS